MVSRNAIAGSVLAVAAITAAGCTTTTVTKGGSSTPPHSSAPASPAPGTSAPLTGAVGTSFTVKGEDSNGATYEYSITLLSLQQEAAPASEFDTAPAGHHLSGAEFRVVGISGQGSDNANFSASVTGSNQQVYQAALDSLAAGTNFNAGDISVAPGEMLVGWVSFEVPDGVTVTAVKWRPGLTETPATWKVS